MQAPLRYGCAVNLNPRLMLWVGLHGVTSVLSIDGEPSVAASTRGEVMSKQSKETGDMFRPSKKPMTEYEAEQLAARKNLERLRAERLAREAIKKDE